MDALVLGGGPGGCEAALVAAQRGARVTLIEERTLGGTCLNRGCIPAKSLLASAEALEWVRAAGTFGITAGEGAANVPAVYGRKDAVVSSLVKGMEFLLQARKVRVVSGHGRVSGPDSVTLTAPGGSVERLSFDALILAAGSVPSIPPVFAYDGDRVLSSDDALSLGSIPASIVLIGGGVIGCELAQFFARLGSRVRVVEMLGRLLPQEDADCARQLERQFKKEKIAFSCGASVEGVEKTDSGVKITLSGGAVVEAEKALVAIGRKPATGGLGLESVGLAPDSRGFVPVNAFMQTAVPSIYAVGDIVSSPQLAHVASREGAVAAIHATGGHGEISYRAIPRCVYTSPEIASVGLTEEDAKKRGIPFKTGKFNFAALGRAKAAGKTEGFVKIITDEAGVVVGGAVVGAHGTELLQPITMAVQLGLTSGQIAQCVFPHPTFGEALLQAALDVGGESPYKVQSPL
ncbi:MAG: dihydrolipoyl dehydrogenase [Spirochaetaceae bacterium]|jgi:dihydrolipoamide dehydrogenase|nr:dihydrolipoyl dehydrogenase [Spirochaetaceae bacterium]